MYILDRQVCKLYRYTYSHATASEVMQVYFEVLERVEFQVSLWD